MSSEPSQGDERIRYRQGKAKGWVAGFYDPAGCIPCGWGTGDTANTDLALRAWKQVDRTFRRWKQPLEKTCLHTDQDSAFTMYVWLDRVLRKDRLEISNSERGAKDNPWIELLWSRLKEEVGQLIFDSQCLAEAEEVVQNYFEYYTNKRRHQSLGQQIPVEVLKQQNNHREQNAPFKRQLVQ